MGLAAGALKKGLDGTRDEALKRVWMSRPRGPAVGVGGGMSWTGAPGARTRYAGAVGAALEHTGRCDPNADEAQRQLREVRGLHTPSERPTISFMISVVPP
jgi:hypothetical protein